MIRDNSVFCRCVSFHGSYMLTRKLNEDTANVFSCSIYNCNWSYCKAVLKCIAKASRGSLMIFYDILSVSQFVKISYFDNS